MSYRHLGKRADRCWIVWILARPALAMAAENSLRLDPVLKAAWTAPAEWRHTGRRDKIDFSSKVT